MSPRWSALALALAVAAGPASAQERPSEEALFGGEDPAPDAGARLTEEALFGGESPPPVTALRAPGALVGSADGGAQARDESVLESTGIVNRFDSGDSKSDALKVGGSVYLRSQAFLSEGRALSEEAFNAPFVVDAFLDGRPTDRLRGFVGARLQYDPTANGSSGTPAFGTQPATAQNPAIFLDQLWLRFDIAQRVFVTVGRQKVRWGTARIWFPTDFLNARPRDPLNPFDVRLGANLIKLHIPVEKLGWNFYAYGLLDNAGPANTLGKLGGAVRAELVLGPAELGLGGVWVAGRRPRYAVDLSTALGPLDVYAEAAFRSGADFTLYRPGSGFNPSLPFAGLYERYSPGGIVVPVSAGVSSTITYLDKYTLVVGGEYFHNPVGASDFNLYPVALFDGNFLPFYAGQHYLAVFASAPGLPNANWITLSASNLLNLSDKTGLIRVDANFRVLTYLTVEAFAQLNYGTKGGELRLAIDVPSFTLPDGTTTQPVSVPAPIGAFGLGLRLAI